MVLSDSLQPSPSSAEEHSGSPTLSEDTLRSLGPSCINRTELLGLLAFVFHFVQILSAILEKATLTCF